jgi:hypothetical protein
VVNTGALIGAIGTVLGAMATVLVGYFVKRTDRVAKLTQANMADQEYVMRLISTIRDDYWALVDWAYAARNTCGDALTQLAKTGKPTGVLPKIPEPRHRLLEARHAKCQPLDDDDY